MPMSEARKRANKKWNDANLKDRYDHIHLTAPKGFLDEVKAVAEIAGIKSVNAFIVQAVQEKLEKQQ
jgi:hypothetical protein